MKKVSSIFLRSDIYPQDVDNFIGWMDNPDVTMYLNEDHALRRNLTQLLRIAPAPLLTFRFNEFGKFFIVCLGKNQSIGFVKLHQIDKGVYEIVYVIVEESLWGRGYGKSALSSALETAFFTLRAKKVVAKYTPKTLAPCALRFPAALYARATTAFCTRPRMQTIFSTDAKTNSPPARENIRKTLLYAGGLFVKGR